jgi:hypothetical protein
VRNISPVKWWSKRLSLKTGQSTIRMIPMGSRPTFTP